MTTRSTSSRPAREVLERELAVAEQRGAARVRELLRELLAERRRVVRLGDHQIEVVEVSALAELLAADPE